MNEYQDEDSRVEFTVLDLARMFIGLILLTFAISYGLTGTPFWWKTTRFTVWLLYGRNLLVFTSPESFEPIYLSLDELKNSAQLGLLLGLNGTIYNVTKSAKFYGPGGKYSFLIGGDCSLNYISGNIAACETVDDYTTLSPAELDVIQQWSAFFTKKYGVCGYITDKPTHKKAFFAAVDAIDAVGEHDEL